MGKQAEKSGGRRFIPKGTAILATAVAFAILLLAAVPAAGLTPPRETTGTTGTTVATGTAVETSGIPSVRVPGVTAGQFQDPDLCGTCHTDIYKEWQNSMHRNYENPAFTWANEQAAKDTGGKTKDFCVSCHTPIGAITGETARVSGAGLSALAKKGVSCDFCHTIDKVNPNWPGNASFHVAPGPIKRAQLKNAVSPSHKTAYSKLHTEPDFCGMCHNLSHPLTGAPLEATYTEWKNSDYSQKGGKTCQDCHMPPKKGRAAKQGPVRPNRFTHTFVGANYRFANRDLAVGNLRKAAKVYLSLSSTEMSPGNNLKATVQVRNVGAGHYLPTGLTELRQMTLELTAKDEEGNKVFRDTKVFGTVLEDAKGKHDGTVPVWEAAKVYSDRRIPPNDSVEEVFEFPLNTQATGDVTVTARLWYRSLPESFTKAAGLAPAVPVEMTSASARVKMVPTWGSVVFGGLLGGSIWLPEIVAVILGVLLVVVLIITWRGRGKKNTG